MKKVIISAISVLTMLSLLVTGLTVSVSAAEASVNIRSVEVSAGDDFRVYVDLEDMKNVVGYEIKISISNSGAVDRISRTDNGNLFYSNGVITIKDSAADFDYSKGYGTPIVSDIPSEVTPSDVPSQEPSSNISSESSSETTSDSPSETSSVISSDTNSNTVTEINPEESGLQVMAPTIESPQVIDYSSLRFTVGVNANTTVDRLNFTVTSFRIDTYSSSVDETGVTYYSKNENVPAGSGSSTGINILVREVSSEASSETSSEETSSEEVSSEMSSETTSEILSNTSSEITSSFEGTDSTVHASSTPTVSQLVSNSNSANRKGKLNIVTILIIILLAFVAGLATMFLVIKLKNVKDDDDLDEEDMEYVGGYQQGFVGGAVTSDSDDGYSTVDDDSDVKVNNPKKPKFDIHIDYDESWNKETETPEEDGFFEITEDKKNDSDGTIEPYFFDED